MWFLLLACAISEPGPATEGSPAAEALVDVSSVGDQAAEVAELADELTALTDEARRRVERGESTKAEEITRMRELMDQIEEKNAALQDTVRKIERDAHENAGDIAWPPEKVEKR
jgi:hypothetical protein